MQNSPNAVPLRIETFSHAIEALRLLSATLERCLPDIEQKCGHDHGLNRAQLLAEAVLGWLHSARQSDPAHKASELILDWTLQSDRRSWNSFHNLADECMLITIAELVDTRLIDHTIRITDHDAATCKEPTAFYFDAVKAGIDALAAKVRDAS